MSGPRNRKPSAKELWDALVAEAGEEEIERAASISVEQAERELTEAGVDVAAERARAEALLLELEGGSPPASARRPKPTT
jgi:hypothetical protein